VKENAPQQIQKKNKCQYCGNIGHVEKVYYKKRDDLEDKFKHLEGDLPFVH
jgi:hypothetical protein